MGLQPPKPMSLPAPGASTSPPPVKAIKGLKQPRIATPRPAMQSHKGTGSQNPFGANKMTIKSASLAEFRHMQQMRKMAQHDPMAMALLALREEQEKDASLIGKGMTWGAGLIHKMKNLFGATGRIGRAADKATHSLASGGLKRMQGTVAKASGDAAKMQRAAVPGSVKQEAVQKAQTAAQNPAIQKAQNLKQVSAPQPTAPKPATPAAHSPTKAQLDPSKARETLAKDRAANRPVQGGQQAAQPKADAAQGGQQTAQPKAETAQQTSAPQGDQQAPAGDMSQQIAQNVSNQVFGNGTIGEAASGGLGWRGAALGAGVVGTGGVVAGGSAVGGLNAAQNQNRLALQQGYNYGVR